MNTSLLNDRLYNAFQLLKKHYSNFKVMNYYSNEIDKYIVFIILNYGENIEIIENPKSEIVVVFDNGKVVKMKNKSEEYLR